MLAPPSEKIPTLREALHQFKRLLRLIRPYWWRLLKGMQLGFAVSLLGMALPYLMKLLIDEVYPAQNVTLMHILVGGILAISIASASIGALQAYYNLYVNAALGNATSLLFFNHLQHLTIRFFEEHRVGEIMSRFQDVRSALGSVNKVLSTFFVQGIYLVLVPPFLLLLQWKLALVALVSIPFIVIITALSGRVLRKYWKRTAEAYAELNALQVETLSQIRTLRTLALEPFIFQKAGAEYDHALRVQLKAGGLKQLFGLSNGILNALNTALFTWLGWTLILSQEMSLGVFIAFTAYIGYLYTPITQFVNLYAEFQQAAVSLGRMFEYLDGLPEQDPLTVYAPPEPIRQVLRGGIELQDVSFGYSPENCVLHEINLSIAPGTTVALVGPSGSGKTSLLRLLTRFEHPQAGRILFDGLPVSQLALPDLRRQVAVVWQEFRLLRGTIWENLTLGLEDVPREVVDEAMQLCRIDTLIHSLPDGLQTPVAEWGASLSGGQRQRLALARALIRNTPLLMLDEATSNIDVQTEVEMLQGLFHRLRDKTVLFVTHRVVAASLADQVCVFEAGRLVAVGTHPQLLRRCVLYRHLYEAATLAAVEEEQSLRVVRSG